MATVREMMMQDAPASIGTSYMMAVGDTYHGVLGTKYDTDWIAVELEADATYVISLTGSVMEDDGGSDDTVLRLYDSKGGLIMMNDDITPSGNDMNADTGDDTNLNSMLTFTPEEDGTYYISASSYMNNPEDDNSGSYTVSVVALDLPLDIEGTDDDDKIFGTDGGEKIAGNDGNDAIYAGGGDDEIDGGDGNDLIQGGPGEDDLTGGDGLDTVSYEHSPMGVTVNLRAGTASGGNADGDELADDFENVRGSENDDDLSGDRGVNKIWGIGGNDVLYGDKSGDFLYGGPGDDELKGGDGDDTLEGGPGADELTGGEDEDTASFASSMMGVTVRLHSRQIEGGDAEGDTWGDLVTVEYELPDEDGEPVEHMETVPDIVHITGSNMDDILAGDSRDNTIMGLGGNDKLYGGPGGGDDILMGGGDDDMAFGGPGDDSLHGGAGDDMLVGGPGDDDYDGGYGSDMIYARDGDEGDDDTGNISGGPADDEGVDTLSYARNEKEVTIDLNDARFTSIESLVGTSEDDTLTGDNAAPTTVEGGDGADTLSGGTGRMNTVSYVSSDRRVSIDLSDETTDTASGGHAQGDTLTEGTFDNIIGSAHDDILIGDNVAATRQNVIKGLAGDDEIIGGDGSDTIEGGPGADGLDGDRGREDGQTQELRGIGAGLDGDTLSYASSGARVVANLATHTYSGGDAEGDEVAVQRGDGADMYDHDDDPDTEALEVSSFENLTGSNHNDRLTGDHRSNTIMGLDGDDVINGGDAMDVLNGGKGADQIKGEGGGDHLIGGPGPDRLDGGEIKGERDNMKPNDAFDPELGESPTNMRMIPLAAEDYDWAVYRSAEASVTVDLSNNEGTDGDADGDRLIGIELVWGSFHNDTFIASADEDTFDIIHGDGGSDTVSYEASDTAVTVNLSTAAHHTTQAPDTTDVDNPIQFPNEETPAVEDVSAGNDVGDATTNGAFGDRLGSIENLTGSSHDDVLTGDTQINILKGLGGDDTLSGGDADDTLYGGSGRDMLSGGAGEDTLDGGTGPDELSGGTDNDTFIFAPGHGDDIINDFADGDQIDLSAFNLDADDLIPLIGIRGDGADGTARVVIDLRSVGGGSIEITDQTDLDAVFDIATGTDPDDSTIDFEANDAIDILDVMSDENPEGTFIL